MNFRYFLCAIFLVFCFTKQTNAVRHKPCAGSPGKHHKSHKCCHSSALPSPANPSPGDCSSLSSDDIAPNENQPFPRPGRRRIVGSRCVWREPDTPADSTREPGFDDQSSQSNSCHKPSRRHCAFWDKGIGLTSVTPISSTSSSKETPPDGDGACPVVRRRRKVGSRCVWYEPGNPTEISKRQCGVWDEPNQEQQPNPSPTNKHCAYWDRGINSPPGSTPTNEDTEDDSSRSSKKRTRGCCHFTYMPGGWSPLLSSNFHHEHYYHGCAHVQLAENSEEAQEEVTTL